MANPSLKAQLHSFAVSDSIGSVHALAVIPPAPRALLVLAHGAGADMHHPFMESMAQAYAAARLATLRYQFPFTERGGRRPDVPRVLMPTVRAAVAYAQNTWPEVPLLLAGKSLGGRMSGNVMGEAQPPAGVRGVVFLGYPLHAPGKPGVSRAAALANVRVPMLFLQGSKDKLATPELVRETCSKLGQLATLVFVDDADHGFAVPKRANLSAEQVAQMLVQHTVTWGLGCSVLAD